MNVTEAESRLKAARERVNNLVAEINGLITKTNNGTLTEGEKERRANLEKGLERAQADADAAKTAFDQAVLAQVRAGGAGCMEGDAKTIARMTGQPYFGGGSDPACYTIDQAFKSGLLPDYAAATAEALVLKSVGEGKSVASEWVRTVGNPEYLTAFCKLLADPIRGHMLWDEAEREAVQAVKAFDARYKGMSTGATAGGELIPLTLDPAIMLTSAGSINPLRRVARNVRTATNTWQGVTSVGVTAEWKVEEAEASDATPATAEKSIPVYFGSAFVPYSYEIGDDALAFSGELAKLLADAADQLQATAFTTGAGTTEPTGIITALDGTASEVTPESAESFTAPDIYKVQNALPARFQARAQWMAGLPTINTAAQFETTNGARLFPELGEGRLLRRQIHECSNMKSTDDINPAATADNHILLYGDFDNFVIVDRIGSRLDLIPVLFGANQRPTGQRGAHLWFRCGADVAVANAFRVLNVATTA